MGELVTEFDPRDRPSVMECLARSGVSKNMTTYVALFSTRQRLKVAPALLISRDTMQFAQSLPFTSAYY